MPFVVLSESYLAVKSSISGMMRKQENVLNTDECAEPHARTKRMFYNREVF